MIYSGKPPKTDNLGVPLFFGPLPFDLYVFKESLTVYWPRCCVPIDDFHNLILLQRAGSPSPKCVLICLDTHHHPWSAGCLLYHPIPVSGIFFNFGHRFSKSLRALSRPCHKKKPPLTCMQTWVKGRSTRGTGHLLCKSKFLTQQAAREHCHSSTLKRKKTRESCEEETVEINVGQEINIPYEFAWIIHVYTFKYT